MHIPDSMMSGSICPVTAVLSAVGIGAAAVGAARAKQKPSGKRFAAVCALIFAAQMINFPVASGTSGHLVGGVLASAVLGLPFGVLALSMVVSIQCLVFSDGGLGVLGANIFNMAIIGAGLGGAINLLLSRKINRTLATAVSAWLAVMLAAAAASLELAWAGVIPLPRVLGAMLRVHAPIGLGEALITIGLVRVLAGKKELNKARNKTLIPLAGAAIIVLMLSPLASSFPDGLEWVAENYHFLGQSAPEFTGLLPDYALPPVGAAAASTILAGLIGVAATFLLAWPVGVALQAKKKD